MSKKKKETKSSSFFSIELFAMAFALLCVLSLVCMFSGDGLFGDLGLIVRTFFLGAFGYVAFPLLFGGLYLGIKGVVGFKVTNGAVKAIIAYLLVYAFLTLIIVQRATTDLSPVTMNEYIDLCYKNGSALTSATAGGVVIAVFVYLLNSAISGTGTYILCSVIMAFVTAFLFRTPLIAMFKRDKNRDMDEKAEEKQTKQKKNERQNKKKNNEDEEVDKGRTNVGRNGDGEESPDRQTLAKGNESSRSDFGGGSEFRLKKQGDNQNLDREYSLKLLFSDDSTNKGTPSYREAFDEEIAAKTDYIRRPYDRRGIRVESTPDSSREMPYNRDEGLDIDVSAPDSDIFVIRNERQGNGNRIRSFDEARGRNTNDQSDDSEYNRDRFVRPNRERYEEESDDSYDDSSERRYEHMRERMYGDSTDGQNTREEVGSSGRDEGDTVRRYMDDNDEDNSENERMAHSRGGFDNKDRPNVVGYRRVVGAEETESTMPARSESSDFGEEDGASDSLVLRKLHEYKNGGRRRGGNGGDYSRIETGEREDNRRETDSRETDLRKRGGRSDSYGDDEGIIGGRIDYPARGNRRNMAEENSADVTDERTERRTRNVDRSEQTRPSNEGQEQSRPNVERAEQQPRQNNAGRSGVIVGGLQTSMEEVERDNPIDNIPKSYRFSFPPMSLLNDYKPDSVLQAKIEKEQREREESILQLLNTPNIDAKIVGIKVGPSLTRFEITIPPRIQMRKVMEKYEDLNLWMAAKSRIRIIAPIPGTSKIGLEVPNSVLTTVGLKETMSSSEFKNAKKNSITFALGKDMVGNTLVSDISKMPHLLVAGATGTGKSVFLNTLLISLMYKYSPEDLRIVLVDPKMVEFTIYSGIPELLFGEIFTDEKETNAMLDWMVGEMDRRYKVFREVMVRDINEYNDYIIEKKGKKMFKILIIIDEFADLMAQGDKKHMDVTIGRLAAKARSAGIHIILATQRPTTDIVDGSIKTNFPSRIVFKMSTPTDAVVVMGESGAEKLLGDGDMFFKVGKMTDVDRAQGAFIDAKEVNAVCQYVRDHNKNYFDENALEEIRKLEEESQNEDVEIDSSDSEEGENASRGGGGVGDNFLKEAMRIAIREGNVSISKLQRKLGVGYPKAGKIVDTLENKGYISPIFDNNKRKILMTAEQFAQVFGEEL